MQDWDLFRYVLAVERYGGLSGAARALGVTHATVSRQLARAEVALGAKLFDRMPSGLVPTAAGQSAAARAKAAEAELLALDLSLMNEEQGALTLTVPPLMMRTHLAADLRDFARAYPGIDLAVLADNRVFDLHRREADLALRVARQPAESLWGRKLVDQRAGYFASPDFLAEHGPALAQGGPVPVIRFTSWPTPLTQDIRAHLPQAYVAATTDDMISGIAMTKAGIGLTRIPFAVARAEGSGEPGLVRVQQMPVTTYGPIWMLTHPDLRRTPIVRLAMRFLAERYAGMAALYTTWEVPPVSG